MKIVTKSPPQNLGASKYCASKRENVWRVSPFAVQNTMNHRLNRIGASLHLMCGFFTECIRKD